MGQWLELVAIVLLTVSLLLLGADSSLHAAAMRRLRWALWVAVVVAAIAAVALALARAHQPNPVPVARPSDGGAGSALVGKELPALQLTDLDGHTVSVSQLRGRPALLNFWATWCIPCRAEMPEIEHEHRQWADRVAIIGVDDGEDAATIRGFTGELGISYPLWRDQTGQVDHLLQAPGLPYTIFLDRDGKVRQVYLGEMDRGYMEQQLTILTKP